MNPLTKFVQLKLERATMQSSELLKQTQQWAATNAISTKCEPREGRLGFRIILEEFSQPPPFDHWGLLLGECAHNLRSALDNLAYALARSHQDPPKSPGNIAFPIFIESNKFKIERQKRLIELPLEAADLIEKLQPFQRNGTPEFGFPENDFLGLLQKLNNVDKHRVPAFVVLAPTSLTHNSEVEFESEELADQELPPDVRIWSGPLVAGITLIEQVTKNPIVNVRGSYKGTAIVQIQMDDKRLSADQIVAMCSYVRLVCSQFDRFF